MGPRRNNCLLAVGFALTLIPATAAAQSPPPETNMFVLIDVGPVAVPNACSCISGPFTIPSARPGWGYGSGPAAPDTNAQPSDADRKRAAREYARERASLRATAEDGREGNGNASIAVAHHFAAGTADDQKEAARWYLLAARQGHQDAYVRLGYRYLRGVGVKANDRTAAYWYHQGAVRGDRVAMVALGLMYAAGRGIPQNWEAAVYWWQQAAAEPGLHVASRLLGDAYACGLGVPQNLEAALQAYQTVAKAGETSGNVQLGRIYESGCVTMDDEAAFKAYMVAADQGDPEAQVAVSDLFFQGRGTPHDAYHAYMWARLAERRLPRGSLQELARARAAQAARLLTPILLDDVEKFVTAVIETGTRPMR
jgi:TPR repeat protein